MKRTIFAASAAVILLHASGAWAQEDRKPTAISDFSKPAAFPKADRQALIEALSEARRLAGDDLFGDFVHRCIVSPVYPRRVQGIQYDGLVEPTQIFDQLYSVGQNAVSAHALVTSGGIVLFDTLNNEDEAKNILVPNLIRMGLRPEAIKYVVITHAHGDHYGGARYLQKTYGARVLASTIDWDGMAAAKEGAGPFAGLAPPDRDIEITDGQTLTIGDTTLAFYVTPGHTPGVLSTIFRVTDHGAPHVVGYFGGTGGGRSVEASRAQIQSLARWRTITQKAGADVLIANHPLHDRGLENNEILRFRGPGDSNPYVLGAERYQRYMRVQEACATVYLARAGVKP